MCKNKPNIILLSSRPKRLSGLPGGKTRSRIFGLLFLLLLLPAVSFAYDDQTTHPALTDEIAHV